MLVLSSLIFSANSEVISALQGGLESFAMSVKVARSEAEGHTSLSQRTFDIIFLDYEDKAAASNLVAAVRASKLNHQTKIISIAADDSALKTAFALGVLLTIVPPKTVEQAKRSLDPFYGFLVRQRQRSLRFGTSIPVQIRTRNGVRVRGKIVNLSETGVALMLAQEVCKAEVVSFDFELPDQSMVIHAMGRIAWSARGEAGLAFSLLSDPERLALQHWIAQQIRSNPISQPPSQQEAVRVFAS